jgi:hypothetical protein
MTRLNRNRRSADLIEASLKNDEGLSCFGRKRY